MKRFFSIIVFVLAGLTAAYAVPAYPGPVQVTQPDGTVLTIYLHGDEFLHWTTCGNSLVAKGPDGYWHYASFQTDGSSKVEGTRVRSTSSGDGSGVTPPVSAVLKARNKRSEMSKRAAAIKKSASVSGSDRHLVMLIQFADTPFTVSNPQTAFSNMLNQDGYSDNGATGSVLNYYSDNSHGIFTPQFDVIGPITVSGKMSSYSEEEDGTTQDGAPRLLAEACTIADPDVDFSKYDLDGDGKIDQIFFYYAGYNAAEGADGIWPHAWNVYYDTFTFDGVVLDQYACSSELKGYSGSGMAGIGTFCHEFGHVIGLPDFYDTDDSTNGYGLALMSLSLMSSGNYNNDGRTPPYLTYEERHILGWDDGLTPLSDGVNTLSKISDNKAYYTPTSNDGEYYLYESRPCEGWDTYTDAPGMAIYHIDKSDYVMPSGYTAAQHWQYGYMINAYGSHQCMDLVETVTPESELADDYQQLTFPGFNKVTSFTSETSPAAVAWSGFPTGYNITGINFDSGTGATSLTVTKERKIVGTVRDVSGEALSGVGIVINYISAEQESPRPASSEMGGLCAVCLASTPGAAEYIVTSDINGEFEVEVQEAGIYSISASKEGYLSYNNSVTVDDATAGVQIIMTTPVDGAGVTLQKYKSVSGYCVGFGANADCYAGLKYTAEELTDYIGSPITSISFMAYNGGNGTADKMGVQVYFDDEQQCDCQASPQVFGTMCTVDLSGCNLKIPSGKSVTFVYYILNPSYERSFVLADYGSAVTNANLYSNNGLNWYSYSAANFVISATITDGAKVIDLSGFNFIQTKSSYKAGEAFDLHLKESSANPPSSVSWSIDGVSHSGTAVSLTEGIYTIRANVTYSSGRTEVIETKIKVTE